MIYDLRSQFPILQRHVHGDKPLVYLDNAATTQKPKAVLDAIADFYATSNANAHRGGHALGAEATGLYESARGTIGRFLSAAPESVVFTHGATEALNLLATSIERTYGASLRGKSIVISEMEHHANIVPWQVLCERTGALLKVTRICDDGSLDMQHAQELIAHNCAVVSIAHMSNVLGTINDVETICTWAREHGAHSIVDGCQFVVHNQVSVDKIGCDAYVFGGHKVYGPFGIGVLYGRPEWLTVLEPYQTGGAMIDNVTFEKTTYAEPPLRFEAGTPNIEGAIGLGAAINWLSSIDRKTVADQETSVTEAMIDGLLQHDRVRVIGGDYARNGIISIVVDGIHANDLGTLMDEQGVAVRTGHHCAMPLMRRLGLQGTLRASVAAYNSIDDAHRFLDAFSRSCRMLG